MQKKINIFEKLNPGLITFKLFVISIILYYANYIYYFFNPNYLQKSIPDLYISILVVISVIVLIYVFKKYRRNTFEWIVLISASQYFIYIGKGKLGYGETLFFVLSILVVYELINDKKNFFIGDFVKLFPFNMLFLFAISLSLFFAPIKFNMNNLKEVIQAFLYYIVIPYVIFIYYLKIENKTDLQKNIFSILFVLILTGILISFNYILEFFFVHKYSLIEFFKKSTFPFRSYHAVLKYVYFHWNTLPGFLIMPLVITTLIGLFFKIKKRIFWILSLILMYFVFTICFSRGSWVGLIFSLMLAGFVLILLFIKKIEIKILFIIFYVFLILCIGSILGYKIYRGIVGENSAKKGFYDGSTYVRYRLYKLNYRIFKKYPITGLGLGNYEILCKNFTVPGDVLDDTPLNLYIWTLSETGTIGFIFYICMFLYPFYLFFKRKIYDKLSIILLLTLIGVYVNNLFTPLMLRGVGIYVWIIYSLAVIYIKSVDSDTTGYSNYKK